MNKQIKIEELENLLFKATRSLRNGDEIVINNCTTCVPFPFKIVAYKNDDGRTTFLVTTNYGDPNCKAMDEGGSSGFHIRDLIQDVFNPDESEMEEIDNCGIWVDDSELAPLALLESKKLEEKSSYNALRDILKDDTLSSTAYTETNEGIEITFSLEELKSVTGMSGVEAIKYLFHCYGCDEEFTELANEEEFITIEFPYTHKNLTESEETDPTGLSDYQKDVIKDMVQADFESGHPMDYENALASMEKDEDLGPVAESAANYYMELVQMGPAGFYKEFKDELAFDPDFVAEYGDSEEDDWNEEDDPLYGYGEDDNSSERDINDCADWYKISQIESLMYMNKGMTPREAKKELGIDPSFEYVPTGHLNESSKSKRINEDEESGFVRDFVDELVEDGLTDEIYEQVTEGKNYSDYQLELVDDAIRHFIDDWRNDSGDVEAETAEEAKQIILDSIDTYLEPNLPEDEADEEADDGYPIKKSKIKRVASSKEITYYPGYLDTNPEIKRLMDSKGMTYEEALDYYEKRSAIEKQMGWGLTYEEAIKKLGYDPSFKCVPTLEGIGFWAKLAAEAKKNQKESITNVARKDWKRVFEGSVKNKNLKNKKLREAITKKAKEKLNLLNDIVNFAYEYGEDATKGLFQQAFKKVTGDDLIDALDDDK